METYANPARKAARDAIQGYMALVRQTYSKRTTIFPPTIHAVVYARLAMEAAQPPRVEVKARKRVSEPKMKMLNAAIRNAEDGDGNLRPDSQNLWFQQNFDKIMYGTGFRFLGYHFQKRVVHVRDDEGRWKEKIMIVHDDIMDEVPCFFNVGVSRDMKQGMFGGRACYWDRFYPRDVFMEQFDTPFYFNIDRVPMDDWFQGDSEKFWEVPEGWVRVRQYWDLYKDLYYVQANGVPIRKDFILDYGDSERPKKFLPITSIHNDVNYDVRQDFFEELPVIQDGRTFTDRRLNGDSKTFWTKSDPQLIQAMVGFKNALWSAAGENAKASSVHFLMAQNAGVFDQINTANLWGVIPIKNADGTTFDVKSMTEGSNFLNQWVGVDEAVDNAMTWALGTDWKRAATELTNEKATVAAIRQQVQRIRLSQNMKFNESGGVKRHYRILVNLIQQYYTEPTLIDLIDGEIPEGTDEEDVIRNPDGQPIQVKKFKDIPFDEAVVEVKRRGKFILTTDDDPLLDESLRGTGEFSFKSRTDFLKTEEEPEIYIEPGSSFLELQVLQQGLNLEKLNTYQFYLGLVYPDKNGVPTPLIPREGAEELLRGTAEVFDDDIDKILGNDNSDPEADKDAEVPPPFSNLLPETEPNINAPEQTLPQQSTPQQAPGLAQQVTL